MNTKPSIVLVHGSFADASGWGRIILTLQKRGYDVSAVQNPLTSYADDVATTKRMIDAQPGNVVVVGHSYGGAVITAAAAGNPNVKALVYVAAFGPDVAETFGDLLGRMGTSGVEATFRPDAIGSLYLDRASFHATFCADLPADEAAVMAVSQKPIPGAIFGASLEAPAWKTIPSWYIVALNDKVIRPDLEQFMAQRMNAKTTEIKASHVVFMSHADEVAKVIVEAAESVK
jgi:pimeloyl-ACP methyl ester carboxylesterase